jgi:glutathione S-transferase
MATPVLAYWGIRGLANSIRQLLEYVGEKYEFKDYNTVPEPGWFGEKFNLGLEFPNLPYYIDQNVKLTQSGAILRYLARKHKLVAKKRRGFDQTRRPRWRDARLPFRLELARLHFRRL